MPARRINAWVSLRCSGSTTVTTSPALPGACGATGTVQVGLVLGGRIDVDDQFDVVDVHAARGDVGGHQHACLAGGERREVAVTGGLRKVAVQVD